MMRTEPVPGPEIPRLLVLDDDAGSGRLVGRIAAAAGFVPVVTTEVGAFQAECEAAPPAVIMLDLQLGVSDGVEQLRYLAARHYQGAVILMSGFDSRVLASVHELATRLDLRVAASFTKPVEVPEVRRALQCLRSQSGPLDVARVLKGLRDNEMMLEYQPIVTRTPRGLRKLEALIRWQHPDLGRLAPGRFIPLVEGNAGAVSALTEWVIARAIQDYARLQQQGVAVPITINVSPRNVLDLAFPDRIGRALANTGMPPHQLCIELTESGALQDIDRAMDILTRIRLKGMHLAIDDFGTGSSSLTLLRRMPFSIVKIDRSFVADVTTSHDARAIVKSIIDLTHNMELENIAEGVETEEVAAVLEALGVDMLQGYLIARPMPVDDIPAWIDGWIGLTEADGAPAPAGRPEGSDCAVAPGAVPAAVQPVRLTPRQADVMRLVAEGQSVKQMARQLGLSIGAIKTYLAQAYANLGAHNRVEALRNAGLVSGDPMPGPRTGGPGFSTQQAGGTRTAA